MQLSEKTRETLARARVLLLEDQIGVSCDFYHVLQPHFDDVLLAHNLDAAFALLANERVDLLLTDVQLSRENGLDLVASLREQGNMLPVVIISAHAEPEYLLRAANLDVQGYLLKPVNFTKLAPMLEKVAGLLAETLGRVGLFRGCYYDPVRRVLVQDGRRVGLGERERLLLELLLARAPEPVSQEDIASHVWHEATMTLPALKNLIGELRDKLGNERIGNIRRRGWYLDAR